MKWTIGDIQALHVDGLSEEARAEMVELLKVWQSRWARNARRSLYCDTEQEFKNLGISLPPSMARTRYVLGWAGQAVKKPAMRSQFQGLRLSGSEDPFELGEVLDANRFPLEFGQATHSAYKHGVSFVTVAKGGPGEPPVQIIAYSAEAAAGLWDARGRRLRAAVTITDTDLEGKPTEFVLWRRDEIVTCTRGSGSWVAESAPNPTGRVLCVPVTNDPELTSPMGRSRLTNSVMVLTDIAARTIARMEGNAEFYSSPQLALLGADEEAFSGMSQDSKFRLAMERIIALTKDEDGDVPTLQQLSQASMTPHSDMIRTVAMAFAGETGIPPSSLGVIHDQPASAEAIRAAEHDLLIDVTRQNETVLPYAVKEIAGLAVMVRDGVSEPPAELWKTTAAFADPEFRSLSAETDAVVKLASVLGGDLSQQSVLLQRLFSDPQVAQIQADARKGAVSGLIGQLASRVQADPGQVEQAMNTHGSGVAGRGDSALDGPGVPGPDGSGVPGQPDGPEQGSDSARGRAR